MKKIIVFSLILLALTSFLKTEILKIFPDMARPTELRINDGNIFISDHLSIFIYDLKSFKLLKKLGNPGSGPQEFNRQDPKVLFTKEKLILYNKDKIIFYTKNFGLVKEMRFKVQMDRVSPIKNSFVMTISEFSDKDNSIVFSLFNANLEKKKVLVSEPIIDNQYLLSPWSICRSSNDRIFIMRVEKGFYMDVFNENGDLIYHIDKNKEVKKIKTQEKHKKAYLDEIYYFVGRMLFEKAKAKGAFDKPLGNDLPPIRNFWVIEDRIYVKTYDIEGNKEKYIIMDLKGNIVKKVFLPIAYREILTFYKNKFYYLDEDEDGGGWRLNSIAID